MATDVRLSVGDGDVTDDLALDGVTGYGVRNGSFSAPFVPGDRYRAITWQEDIYGTTGDDLWSKLGALNQKLRQAQIAAGPYGHGSRVTLSMKFAGATNYLYADIVSGWIDIDQENFSGPTLDATWIPSVTVMLICEPYLRGAPVTTTVSGTLTLTTGAFGTPGGAAASGGLFIANIPGDVPALVRHQIEDVSTTSLYLNRLRISSFSVPDPASIYAASDFTPYIDDTPAGAGLALADATAAGGSCSDISLSAVLQRVASYPKPSGALNNGLFDVFARVRDSNTLIGTPVLNAVSVQPNVNMPTRQQVTYQSTSSASHTPTWSQPTKAGSFLAMAVMVGGNPTITTPTGWTVGPTVTHGSNTAKVAWFYIEASASRSGAETVTLSGAVRGSTVMFEIVGARYAGAHDIVPTGTATATTCVIATGARAQARELTFAAFYSTYTGAGTRSVTSGDTDTTLLYNGSLNYRGFVGRGRSTATTTQNYTATTGSSSDIAGALLGVRTQPDLAPNIATGTYEIAVVAASASDVSLSLPSNVQTATVTQTDSVIMAEWTPVAPFSGIDHYRIYYRVTGGTWEYYAQPAAAPYPAYFIADLAGTAGDPPDNGPTSSLVYLLVALSSGVQTYFTKAVPTALGGNQWEWLHLGLVPAPPMPHGDGLAPRDWIMFVEAKNENGTGTFDADCLAILPHPLPSADNRHIVIAEYKNLALAALRRWNIETRRDGATFGYVSTTGTDTEQGQLSVVGDSLAGPGDTWLTCVGDMADGVSSTSDGKLTWTVTYTPRYVWPR